MKESRPKARKKIHSQYKLRDIRTLCASADGTGRMKAVAQNAKI